jgi:hypothetical protein
MTALPAEQGSNGIAWPGTTTAGVGQERPLADGTLAGL